MGRDSLNFYWMKPRAYFQPGILLLVIWLMCWTISATAQGGRQRVSINEGWRFFIGDPPGATGLSYDVRPKVTDRNDNVVADTKPTEAVGTIAVDTVLKKWILPTANNFTRDPAKHHQRPAGHPGGNLSFVQAGLDDHFWEKVNLPHDWAIKGPFYTEEDAIVGGGMGRLPIQGVAWYRRKLDIPITDKGRNIYLDIDGAMSYSTVWLNGKLIGGWPYGYNSYRLDLTPFIKPGQVNQLAIRLDNPTHSARWYPGAGLYRNVWITKTDPVHVAHWGSFVTTKNISTAAATIDLAVEVENNSKFFRNVQVTTELYLFDAKFDRRGMKVAGYPPSTIKLGAGERKKTSGTLILKNPRLWGPPPSQHPNLYVAVTKILQNGKTMDEYETRFGIRSLQFDPVKGLFVNGQPVRFQGVNQHHDLGALGAAFNTRAAERQLEILKEMGCNAIRLAHNPPAPELLDLADRMGFLVINEIFDSWERKKTPLDFHLVFPDWHEADTRSFIRRDRNHPSVIAWSYGNEVGEQYTAEAGAVISQRLKEIVAEEDPTRPATVSMNYAKPDMPFSRVPDLISLNYQGEGIRDAPAYSHLKGIRTNPLYPAFHEKFPGKMIVSSETASALSTRGSYIFPVASGNSAPVSDSTGGDPVNRYVSAYELYTAAFGASPDKVFASQDKHPFVSGEFVWSGWDYLGEPTPYYTARSSYSGIIDLAGFKKNRFYLYQSRWRADLPMVHILPHWNWPDRVGKITPVHVFTSGDEAELFINGRSLGRKKKAALEYRLRWDEIIYEPGKLRTVAYKNGKEWAEQTIETTGEPVALRITADRSLIKADGYDLVFVTIEAIDKSGKTVPVANNLVNWKIDGTGDLVATDNGDPASLVSFASRERALYFGSGLAIVRSFKGKKGLVKITASSPGLATASVAIKTE